jgi:hypothetical protein
MILNDKPLDLVSITDKRKMKGKREEIYPSEMRHGWVSHLHPHS